MASAMPHSSLIVVIPRGHQPTGNLLSRFFPQRISLAWSQPPHQVTYSLMLDLAFVRDHLPLVEEKLRQRGVDPNVVLKDFQSIDSQRRVAITEAETDGKRRA